MCDKCTLMPLFRFWFDCMTEEVCFTTQIQTLKNFNNALLQKIYSSSVQCDGLPVDQQVAAWRSDRHQTERSGWWWSSPGARPGFVSVSNHRAAGKHKTGSRKCQTCGLGDQRCTQPNTTLYLMLAHEYAHCYYSTALLWSLQQCLTHVDVKGAIKRIFWKKK